MTQTFYSVGIYGRLPKQVAMCSGVLEGLPYPPENLDEFEKALYAVAGQDGLPSAPALLGGEELGLRVSVEAESATEALLRVVDFYRRAARRVYGEAPVIDEVESIEQQKFERREQSRRSRSAAELEADPENADLVGKSAAARILGVAPQRVDRIERDRAAGRRDDFPEPALVDERKRRYWLRADIEEFDRSWRRKRTGRPQRPASSG